MQVEFDLQEYLAQMEARLQQRLAAVHTDVKTQSGRIREVEQEVWKIRWVWRAGSGMLISLLTWVSYQVYEAML